MVQFEGVLAHGSNQVLSKASIRIEACGFAMPSHVNHTLVERINIAQVIHG